MDTDKMTSEGKDINQWASEEENKKVLIYHGSQTFLLKIGDKIMWKGEEQKGADGQQITDAEPYFNEFCFNFFSQPFEHISILAAAGTSVDNGNGQGKTRNELWEACEETLETIERKIAPVKLLDKKFWTDKNLEEALSYINSYQALNISDVSSELNKIKQIIRDNCKLILDKESPHEDFLRKITARKINSSRIQLFTTNYDTLWEQAASCAGIIVIDGFSFSHPRKFSGRFFDIDIVNRERTRIKNEDNFIPNVIHLYKLHGSLDWKRDDVDVIQTDEDNNDALLIYPASNKYENSYRQPYFEMMSRFQQSLRRDNVLLLIMGFGFQDMHIENMIKEAVKQNPSLHVLILDYNKNNTIDVEKYEKIFVGAMSKVTIFFGTFKDFAKRLPINKVYLEDNHEKDF